MRKLRGVFNGIGDVLVAALALHGAHLAFPQDQIVFYARNDLHKWIGLFDVGLTSIQNLNLAGASPDLNKNYMVECRTHAAIPRFIRYCNNIDPIVKPAVPPLRNRDKLKEQGLQYANAILLSVLSVYNNRNYDKFLEVEQLLIDKGERCIILHSDAEKISAFKSEKMVNQSPEIIAGAICNAKALASVDSGMAHLSSMIGAKTVVLTGPTSAAKIFFCPVIEVAAELWCKSCFWQQGYTRKCDTEGCAALKLIEPQKVVDAILG